MVGMVFLCLLVGRGSGEKEGIELLPVVLFNFLSLSLSLSLCLRWLNLD